MDPTRRAGPAPRPRQRNPAPRTVTVRRDPRNDWRTANVRTSGDRMAENVRHPLPSIAPDPTQREWTIPAFPTDESTPITPTGGVAIRVREQTTTVWGCRRHTGNGCHSRGLSKAWSQSSEMSEAKPCKWNGTGRMDEIRTNANTSEPPNPSRRVRRFGHRWSSAHTTRRGSRIGRDEKPPADPRSSTLPVPGPAGLRANEAHRYRSIPTMI